MKLEDLRKQLTSSISLSKFMIEAGKIIAFVKELTVGTLQKLRPGRMLGQTLDVAIARVFCYGAVEGNETGVDPLCQQDCGEPLEALELLRPFVDLSKDPVLRLVQEAANTHCVHKAAVSDNCTFFDESGSSHHQLPANHFIVRTKLLFQLHTLFTPTQRNTQSLSSVCTTPQS